MPSGRNQKMLENFEKTLQENRDFFIAENRGLSVGDLTELRGKLKKQGAVCQVMKNRLVKIALRRKTEVVDLDKILTGPNILLLGNYPIELAKVLSEFVKTCKDKVVIKGGWTEGKIVQPDFIQELGALSSREELIARLLRVFNYPLQKLVLVLDGIKKKKPEA